MQLSIKYMESGPLVAEGVFIRGTDAGEWLRVIAGWGASLDKFTCFVLSDRHDVQTPAGLFVVWEGEFSIAWSDKVHPYRKVGGKLFIPADAALSPAVLPEELSALLIWDYQFFHPVHGFTGYELKDRLLWGTVLEIPGATGKDWSYASTGMPALPPLMNIALAETSEEEMFDEQKEQVSSKPIEELTAEKKKKNFFTKLRDKLYLLLLKGILKGLNGFIKLLSSGKGGGAADPSHPVNRFMNWANTRIEELERQRAGELQRLLDLFESDQDEALQYAIPLNSPYLDRGEAPPSGKLGRRDINFNLGRLRGGGRTDSWNVDAYYNSLRNKYERAAEQAKAAGDHKKAAYIYAHLLGNYGAAAKVLEEGKYFHEAACLYKDHLNNPAAAAECLERGGLLSEALDLYEELGQDEKCGDLCLQMGQEHKAHEFFLLASYRAEDRKDYKELARLLKDKAGDREGAKNALLKGWRADRQPEYFLKEYFDMYAAEDRARLHQQVRRAYQQKDISYNKEAFLQVVATVNKQYREEALENTCRDIAFDIVSGQVKEGNTEIVHKLRKFFPDDPLLGADCHRYVHQPRLLIKQVYPREQLLSQDAVWMKAVAVKGQALVLGFAGQDVMIARGNWKGKWEYNMLMGNGKADNHLAITGGKELTGFILHVNGGGPGKVELKSSSIFSEELVLESPGWMPAGVRGISMTQAGVAVFHNEGADFFISRYDAEGGLIASHRCVAGNLPVNLQGFTQLAREMLWLDGYYYLPAGLVLLRISENGEMASFSAGSWIQDLQLVSLDGVMCLAVLASGDCLIVHPKEFSVPKMVNYRIDDLEAVAMGVLDDRMLVLAGQTSLMVYKLLNNGNAETMFTAAIKEAPIAILPTARRGQLGVVTKSGQVTLIDVLPDS